MAEKCVVCDSGEGSRFQCPRMGQIVVCRDCCIVLLKGHHCVWWDLCNATDLSIWEW